MEQRPNPEEEQEGLKGKLHELLDESDGEECGQFRFQEETVEEVMQELYKVIAFPTPLSQTVPSSVLVNDGKNGSCGASVSDTASTLMAGIEVVSPAGDGWFPVTGNVSGAEVEVEEEKKIDGFDLDDEWIGRVLTASLESAESYSSGGG